MYWISFYLYIDPQRVKGTPGHNANATRATRSYVRFAHCAPHVPPYMPQLLAPPYAAPFTQTHIGYSYNNDGMGDSKWDGGWQMGCV